MTKNYLRLVPFTLLLLWSFSVSAQMLANDDFFDDMNGITGSNTLPANNPLRVIHNDLINGNPVVASNGSITQLSSTSPGVSLITNGGGYVKVNEGTPAGTYYITYQVCDGPLCDTAVVTVQVCGVPAPVNLTDCDTPLGTLVLGGLPETESWSIWGKMSGSFPDYWSAPYTQFATGTGSTATLTGLMPNQSYRFKVMVGSGCSSDYVTVYVGQVGNLGATFLGEMSGSYVDLNNDGIVNIGDIVRYDFLFTNASDCDIHDVYYNLDSNGAIGTIDIIPANSTATGSLNTPLTEDAINYGSFNDLGMYGGTYPNGQTEGFKTFDEGVDLAIADGFKVHAFLDENANNVQDNSEADFTDGYFKIVRVDINQAIQIYPSNPSYIIYESNPDQLYNISYMLNGNCQYVNTVAYSNVSVATGSGIATYNFPIGHTPDVCNDAAIALYALGAPRPGFEYKNAITYKNNGLLPYHRERSLLLRMIWFRLYQCRSQAQFLPAAALLTTSATFSPANRGNLSLRCRFR